MGSPTRHGVDWGRVGPSPTAPAELDVSKKGGGGGGSPFAPAPPPQVVPVSVIDAFYQELPDQSIQPIIKTMEAQYDFTKLQPYDPASLGSIDAISMSFFTVPAQYVYIIVDVFYYAVAPGTGLNVPPVQLTSDQLAGVCRFNLTFGGRQPARFDVSAFSPYANPGGTATLRTGFPFTETQFGPRRTTGFAVYARSSQEVLVTVNFDVVPQFLLTKLGAHMHGYAVPEGAFEDIFMRRRLGR